MIRFWLAVMVAILALVGLATVIEEAKAGTRDLNDYNQGLAVGNDILLAKATHNKAWLKKAHHIVSLCHYPRARSQGDILRRGVYIRAVQTLNHRQHRPSHVRRELSIIPRYWDPSVQALAPIPGGHSDFYYDDNVWAAIDEMRGYELTHDPSYLAWAQRIMRFLEQGWTRYGGVLWHRPPSRPVITTISTAGAEQVALHLYLATRQYAYKTWALRAQHWLDRVMRAPNGLYRDSIYFRHGHLTWVSPKVRHASGGWVNPNIPYLWPTSQKIARSIQ